MTYSSNSFAPALRLAVVSDLYHAIAAVTLRVLQAHRVNKTARLLKRLDNHVLRDIGLARDEILAASRRAAMGGGHRIAR